MDDRVRVSRRRRERGDVRYVARRNDDGINRLPHGDRDLDFIRRHYSKYATANPICATNIIRYMCAHETWLASTASSSGRRSIRQQTYTPYTVMTTTRICRTREMPVRMP